MLNTSERTHAGFFKRQEMQDLFIWSQLNDKKNHVICDWIEHLKWNWALEYLNICNWNKE